MHFIHISDTHIGPKKDFLQYEQNTYSHFERFLKGLNKLDFNLDFIIHTGDVVSAPDRDSYLLAKELIDSSKVPVYFAVGNHDDPKVIRSFLDKYEIEYLDEEFLIYSFISHGIEFISLDTKGPEEIDPKGLISERELAVLKRALNRSRRDVVIFLHFSPVNTGVPWLDKNMALINREKLTEIFAEYRGRIRGVFFGHIHSSFDILKDNIFYSGVGSLFRQFTTWPNLDKAALEKNHSPHFNCVTLDQNSLMVKHCSLELLD